MKSLQDAHKEILKKAMDDIQNIWRKYGTETQGKDGPCTSEVNRRWDQYRKEFAELKKKYKVD